MLSPTPWNSNTPPERILLIRMQALGDTVITLPYAKALKSSLPHASVDLLTRDEVAGIPQDSGIFDRIYIIRGRRNMRLQLIHLLALLPRLMLARYDVLIDLQNNRLSRIVARVVRTRAYAEFDRYSALPAGDRTLSTINAVGCATIHPAFDVGSKRVDEARRLLVDSGWIEGAPLIVLNPGGFLPSRNWPLERYIEFAQNWSRHIDGNAQFLILGLDRIREQAALIEKGIGSKVVNLVGRTTPEQAFAAIGFATLMLSEDSGLMHMAWVRGIPTLALFGSSRSDWSRPLGAHSACLSSADLECGECMRTHCRFGDNRCLTRYSPEFVVETAVRLLERTYAKEKNRGHH